MKGARYDSGAWGRSRACAPVFVIGGGTTPPPTIDEIEAYRAAVSEALGRYLGCQHNYAMRVAIGRGRSPEETADLMRRGLS